MNEILLNVVVLALEVLYYALFMKFARKEGKFWRYLLSFSLVNIVLMFIGTNQIYSYLLTMLMMLYGIKYIVKIKTSIYDLLFLFIMMLIKTEIEGISCFLFFNLVSPFLFIMIIDFLKIFFIITLRNKIETLYKYLKLKWSNNNFYIRYIFNILMFAYILMSCFFLFNR